MTAGDVTFLGAVGVEIEPLDGVMDDDVLTEDTLLLRMVYAEGAKVRDMGNLPRVVRYGRLIASVIKDFLTENKGGSVPMDDEATFRLVSMHVNLEYRAQTTDSDVIKRNSCAKIAQDIVTAGLAAARHDTNASRKAVKDYKAVSNAQLPWSNMRDLAAAMEK